MSKILKLDTGHGHHRMQVWFRTILILVVGFTGSFLMLSAQVTATLNGTVTDPSGGVISNARVTLTNDATREQRIVTSNGSGFFSYPSLNPGSYSVRVEAKGFSAMEQHGIQLSAGDSKNIPGLALTVGSTQDTVSVNVSSQIIPVESGERAAVLESADIDQLALAGRNVDELLKVLPGVTSVANGISNGASFNDLNVGAAQSPVGENQLNANGAANRGGTSQFEDGVDIDDPGCDCNSIATLNPDMVQEVSVQTSNFGADAPRGPIVINAISKSGGANYHGTGYFYARNDKLNANDWLSNHNGLPRGNAHYYYPGGNIGGPIPFTHKKVLTWFGYERFIQNTGNSNTLESYIPTPDMMAGNFTNTPANVAFCQGDLNSSLTNGCNDLTGTVLPDGSVVGQGSRPAGMIPQEFIDPGALALAKIWPAANATPSPNNGGFNYVQPLPGTHDGWIYRIRVDYDFNQNNLFYFSYQQGYDTQSGGAHVFWQPANSIPFPGGGLQQLAKTKALAGHFTHIFGPTLTNEFIASWGYGYFPDGFVSNIAADYRSTLGYPSSYGTVFNGGAKLIPSYASAGPNTFPDFSQGDIFESGGVYFFRKQMPTFADNLTKVWGTHTAKFGIYAENVDNYGSSYGSLNGSFNSFSGQAKNAVTGQLTGSPKNPTANFLMGDTTSYSENNIQPPDDMAFQTFSFYGNDLWKATKRLTVEYGLRFDHIGHWYDRQNNGVAVWMPNLVAADAGAGQLDPGLRWHAIDKSIPKSGQPDAFLYTEPRFGLSYDVFGTGNTMLRGGWGEYRFAPSNNNTLNALTTAQSQLNYSLPGQSSVLFSQLGLLKPPASSGPNGTVYAVGANDKTQPLTRSYNLTISQQAPWKSLFEIAYVGSKSSYLLAGSGDNIGGNFSDYNNQNKVPFGAFFKADPVTGIVSPNPENLGGPGSPNNQESDYRPYGSAYGTNSIDVNSPTAYSNYNGLQLTWIKRSDKLTFNLNYTWSKTLGTALPVDPFNIRNDYGVLYSDRPQVFNTSYSYNLGNRYHGYRVLKGVANGWTVSGITTFQTGGNLQALNSVNFNLGLSYAESTLPTGVTSTLTQATYFGTTASYSIQPVTTCNPGAGLASMQRVQLKCFAAPAIGTSGPRQYPYLAGANYFDSDLAAFKTFHLTEKQTVEFRASAFNWLNHPLPGFSSNKQLALNYVADYATKQFSFNNLTSENFGYLDSKAGAPSQRITELSLKYRF